MKTRFKSSIAKRIGAWMAGGILALLLVPAQAQSPTDSPMDSSAIERPVRADRDGMVVSQNKLASEVGAKMLRKGGNAVDAAVATAFALAVTLPRAGNIGGSGYMLIHLAEEGRTVAIDYRSMAPGAATLDAYLDTDGKVTGSSKGYRSAGVPGTVAGLALAHRKYGKLPWKEVLRPAIRLADEGFILDPGKAAALNWGRERLQGSQAGAAVFLRADGSPWKSGQRLVQPDLAWSLREIAGHGAESFYRGAIAKRLVKGMQQHGGLITFDDLGSYRPVERTVLSGSYRGVEIAAMPPSSGGGTMIVEMLNMLENTDLKALGAGSAATLHMEAEVMKRAWADRSEYLGDPDFIDVPLAALTSKVYAADRAADISPTSRAHSVSDLSAGDVSKYDGQNDKQADDARAEGDLALAVKESPSTTQISVIDGDGNAVSNTYTLGAEFGSGVMIDGTGFLLDNLIGNFSIAAQAKAKRDGRPAPPNALGPGRRPVSSMSPTILLRDGKPWVVTGSPGGNTIPGTVLQMIVNLVDFDMNIAEATHAPRIHQDLRSDGTLRVEHALNPDTVQKLEKLGHHVVTRDSIGSTQTLIRNKDGIWGSADPRRIGAAAISK